MADNSGDLGSFLAGFVIGGLIGAGVALLMAPQSGEETRAIIQEKSIELKDMAAATAEDAIARAEEAAAEARAYADDLKVKAEEAIANREGDMDIAEAQSKLLEAVAQLQMIERFRKRR